MSAPAPHPSEFVVHDAGDKMEAMADKLARIGVVPTSETLTVLLCMIIAQAVEIGMAREHFVGWVDRTFAKVEADIAAQKIKSAQGAP